MGLVDRTRCRLRSMANMELSSSLRRQEPRLGPRINLRRDVPRHSLAFLSRLLRRSQKDCIDTQEENTCSKPISSSVENLPIILGTMYVTAAPTFLRSLHY